MKYVVVQTGTKRWVVGRPRLGHKGEYTSICETTSEYNAREIVKHLNEQGLNMADPPIWVVAADPRGFRAFPLSDHGLTNTGWPVNE